MTKIDDTKWSGALNKLEGKRVLLSYSVGETQAMSVKQTCAGTLQWSAELQRWAVVRDDRNWKDRVEFVTADVETVQNMRSRLPYVWLRRPEAHRLTPQVIRLCGVWRSELVSDPKNRNLVGYQVVTDDANVGRLVIAEIFVNSYPVELNQNHAAMIAAAPEMYAALKVLTLVEKTRDYLSINDRKSLEQAERAIEKAERLGA